MPWMPRRVGRALLRIAVGVALFIVVGNVTIYGYSLVAQFRYGRPPPVAGISGVPHLEAVDARVWRGAHPNNASYRQLALNGVTTVVDLRAESDAGKSDVVAAAAGLDVVHIPVRDGQSPTADDLSLFLKIVDHAEGTVFLHCGAGVGRTGAMAAAYLVATGQASAGEALQRNLAVGPPSLEQIAFVRDLDGGGRLQDPGPIVTAVSRVLDFPRRLAAIL